MFKNSQAKGGATGFFSMFRTAKDGGVTIDRSKLHDSPEYKRQVSALGELSRQMAAKKKMT